jgi:hypothetical protein
MELTAYPRRNRGHTLQAILRSPARGLVYELVGHDSQAVSERSQARVAGSGQIVPFGRHWALRGRKQTFAGGHWASRCLQIVDPRGRAQGGLGYPP